MIKNISAILLACFALSLHAAIPTVPNDLLIGWQSITPALLKKDLYFLSADKLKGRLSLTQGDSDTIQWLVKQFQQAGLSPAAGQNYLQAVPLIQYTPDLKESYVQLERKGNDSRWFKPDVYTEFNKNINVKSAIVFAGYGITAPALKYDDYRDANVEGKIVLIFEHEPQETNAHSRFNGTANTIHATNRVKALNAQKHGAIAVLIAPEPNRKHPSNAQRYAAIGGTTKRAVPIPSQVLVDDELHIPVAVITDEVAKKIAGPSLSLSAAQISIDKNLQPLTQSIPNSEITIHDVNSTRTTGTTYNVVGLLKGQDKALSAETIIISAHHDHDGNVDKQIWHGADDNASGTVGVVALANAFNKNGHAPKRSILFVVFAAEERGLLGAYYMAAHPLRPLGTTRAMINFDMIGRNEQPSTQTNHIMNIPKNTSNRLNLIGSHYSPDYKRTVVAENKYVNLILDKRFDEEAALNVFFRSDQFPFVLQEVPAFWWFTGFHPDYHHITDTADKINYIKMTKILRLAYLSSYAFADERVPPKFIENP